MVDYLSVDYLSPNSINNSAAMTTCSYSAAVGIKIEYPLVVYSTGYLITIKKEKNKLTDISKY